MDTTARSSRARIAGLVATGISAAISTLAVAGSVAAADVHPSGADVSRLELWSDTWCYQGDLGSVTFYYDDLADGHVPQQVHEQVVAGSSVVWTRDDLYAENGNYFNMQTFSFAGGTAPFDRNASLTYSVTMSYDDGVAQTRITSIDLAGECTGTSPTTVPTTAPTTAPTPAPDRFQMGEGLRGCGTSNAGAFIEWSYGDYPDGHYAVRFDIDMLKNGAVVERHTTAGGDPTSDGASTSFDIRPDATGDEALDPFFDTLTLEPAAYSLSITVTYDDGATDQHIVTVDLDGLCDGRVNGRTAAPPATGPSTTAPAGIVTPTTTAPGGTLPETGNGDLTWIIGAVAALLTTAGAALITGIRRSRVD